MNNEAVVAVLARRAELGRGKTRLAATLGAEQTLLAYRHLIGRTAETVAASGMAATVFFDPEPGDAEVWPPDSFAYETQEDTHDLGQRIYAALRQVLAKAAPGVNGALVLGTDCPYLRPWHLGQAAALLADHDVVIGPATDGGYYLLGVRAAHPTLFEDIAWSSAQVAAQTAAAAAQLGWRVAHLEPLDDIDTEADWRAYRATPAAL